MDETQKILQQIVESELSREEKIALLAKLPSALLEEKIRDGLAHDSHADSPDGFFAFCELLDGAKLPEHNQKEVHKVFEAHEQGKGFTLNGWRGSFKSVTLSAKFATWRIGLYPHQTNVIVSANDDSAEKITKAIARYISDHPEWKRAFGTIVPVTSSWAVNGYWVRDTSLSDDEWAKKTGQTIDPTFVGGGHTSTRINGKHPTGCLIIDDIQSTFLSAKEQKDLAHTVTAVILKMAVRKDDKLSTWVLNIGVPWPGEYDVHQILSKSGAFLSMTVPAMRRAVEGEGVYIDGVNPATGQVYDDIVGWWVLTEPSRFGVNSILSERALGKFEFWQMIMMDLDTAKATGLRYYTFPKEDVDNNWPTVGGVDPAFTLKDKLEDARKNSAFAIAYVSKRPARGAVLVGGVLERCNPGVAASRIAAAQILFPAWSFSAVENSGIGLLFIKTMNLLNPGLVIVPSDLGGIRPKGQKAARARSKHDRILYELSPFLEDATVMIAGDDYYTTKVKDALDNFFELDETVADERWDALDALYHAVKAMPDVLQKPKVGETLQVSKPKSRSPIAGMGKHRGY